MLLFDEGLREEHAKLEPLAGSSATAWALISQSVGGLMLARATLVAVLQRELLESARIEARSLLGQDRNDS